MKMDNPAALTAQLRALGTAVTEHALRQAAVAGARVFQDEMKLRVPVKSGEGRKSIIVAYDAEASVEGAIASYIVTWLKGAFYLRFVEYGTSKMAAKPFMRPAYEAKKTAAAQAVADVIELKVKEATRV
jgi:HK97 gp10 family phage protein